MAATEDYNIVPSQRFLDHDDGDEDDVGHDAHAAQAGQDHRRDLVRLNTNTVDKGYTQADKVDVLPYKLYFTYFNIYFLYTYFQWKAIFVTFRI